jgi:NADH:ubiquinone oxidoreductase subunit H
VRHIIIIISIGIIIIIIIIAIVFSSISLRLLTIVRFQQVLSPLILTSYLGYAL